MQFSEIQNYNFLLTSNPKSFIPNCCANCAGDKCLRIHELRKRHFWPVVDRMVKKVLTRVLRVACSLCSARITVTPDFALPYHRYLRKEVSKRSSCYLEQAEATYDSCTRQNKMPIHHQDENSGQVLARSTVHRWIRFLGVLTVLTRESTNQLMQLDSSYSPTDLCTPIPHNKFRSNARCQLLHQARRFLSIRKKLKNLLDLPDFPILATTKTWN